MADKPKSTPNAEDDADDVVVVVHEITMDGGTRKGDDGSLRRRKKKEDAAVRRMMPTTWLWVKASTQECPTNEGAEAKHIVNSRRPNRKTDTSDENHQLEKVGQLSPNEVGRQTEDYVEAKHMINSKGQSEA